MTETSEDKDDSKFLAQTKKLHQILECPICLEVVKAPVQECKNGHLTCSACVSKMVDKMCSLCQQEFCIENSTFVKYLLESLPKFCRFADQGCKRVCESGDDHELYCNFRTVICKVVICKQNILIPHLQEHYKDKHPTVHCITNPKGVLHWPDFYPEKDRTAYVPVFVYGQVFFLHLNNNSFTHKLKLTLEAFLLKKPERDFFVTIKIEKGDISFCKSIKAIIMKEDGDSIGSDMPDTTDDDVSLTVPSRFLPELINEDKALPWTYAFLTL